MNLIDKILTEWSYRVHDGMPNPKNTEHIHELRESMEELNLPNNVIYQVIENLINEVTDKETEFKARSKETNKIIYFKNQDNLDKALDSGTAIPFEKGDGLEPKEPSTDEKPPPKPKIVDIPNNQFDKKEKKEKKPKSEVDNQREKIGGKTYSEPLETTDEDFYTKNNTNKTTNTFKMPDSVKNNPKIPKKYTQFIERVMNTQLSSKKNKIEDETNLSSYYGMGKAGAGGARANAGELLSMMATTMRKKERDEFFRAVDEHIQTATARGEAINITKKWSKAAKENSSAILRMMYDRHGPDYEIVGSAWDIEEEFKALGQNYDEKGYSTDIMFTVKVGDMLIKEEISLKQSLKGQRLWNGTIGSVFKDKGIIPKHLEQKGANQFADNQIKNIDNFYQNNQMNISEYLNNIDDISDFDERLLRVATDMDSATKNKTIKGFNNFLTQYKKDLTDNPNLVLSRDYIIQNLKTRGEGGKKRNIDKISMTLGRLMNGMGDELGGDFVNQQKQIAKEHAKDVAKVIRDSNEAKGLIMDVVRKNFPLKSVSNGSENVILGEFVISKKVMKGLFGTDDWNQVVEQLVVNPDADPPSIEYQGKVRGKDVSIPITTIGIREDGEGYGGTHKFEMKVADNFGKNVELVSRDIYGDQEPIKFPNSIASDLRRQEEE